MMVAWFQSIELRAELNSKITKGNGELKSRDVGVEVLYGVAIFRHWRPRLAVVQSYFLC